MKLGITWSFEQTWESVYDNFKNTWQRYEVNGIDRPIYGEQLSETVSLYNSRHI